MADNSTTLQNGKAAWEGRSGAPANRRPKDYLEGKLINVSADGNASATTFNVAHGLTNDAGNGVIPSSYSFEPTNQVSAATHWLTATTANVVLNFAAAPASGTGNVQGKLRVYY